MEEIRKKEISYYTTSAVLQKDPALNCWSGKYRKEHNTSGCMLINRTGTRRRKKRLLQKYCLTQSSNLTFSKKKESELLDNFSSLGLQLECMCKH